MSVFGVVSAVAGVAGIVSGISAGEQAQSNAEAQNTYNQQVEQQQSEYRLEVMKFNNVAYSKEIDNYENEINYEKSEFTRASALITTQKQNIDEDYTAKIGTELLKSVQENVSRQFQLTAIDTQGAQETGKADVSAAERGVGGNSATIQRGEVARQVGAADTAVGRNFDAQQAQAKVEMLGLKASHDSAVAGLTLPTFAPIAPPQAPAPVSPVNPAPTVAVPSTGSVILGGLSSGLNLGTDALKIGNYISSQNSET